MFNEVEMTSGGQRVHDVNMLRERLKEQGLDPERLRTVSYGKEFPFDGGDDEGAWSQNRRAHFVITAR